MPFALPDIDEADIDAVEEVLRSGWLTTGPKVQEFESQFADRLGITNAVAVNSGTAALHLALEAIGLNAGDEVILPDFTFTATAEVVRHFDANPVLLDVESDILCLDPESLETRITSRTKAIIAVHFGGHPASMDEVMAIARRHELVVIEDAAHALPGSYKGHPMGTMGQLAAFSFYATKTITTGEGGMLVTGNDDFAARARSMSLHGMSRQAWKRYAGQSSWRYDVVAPGFKYNMTDIAAALGVSQLQKADRMWRRRDEIAKRYSDAFANHPALQAPSVRDYVEPAWHLYVLRLNLEQLRIGRDEFIEELSGRGISTSVHFIPLHRFTYYRERYGLEESMFPVSSREFERVVSLPIYSRMSDEDVEDVIAAVLEEAEEHQA